jgi:hypothetical protein
MRNTAPYPHTTTIAALTAILSLTACAPNTTPDPVAYAATAPASAPARTERAVQYIVIPHEDDEWEAWSEVENRPDLFKVFIVLGRGEQTNYCDHYTDGFQPSLEVPATPTPTGRFTTDCEQARLSSWRNYFTQMATTDPTLPGNVTDLGHTEQFPAADAEVCRRDSLEQDAPCTVTDRSAQVWEDQAGRGVLIAFNLGEGDEDATEIDWALDTVFANPTAFRIPTELPAWGMLGGYSNLDNPDCFIYTNPDHAALHTALRENAYPVPFQGAAACGTTPGVTLHEQVTEQTMAAAFTIGAGNERLGAHVANYGWLHPDYYALSPHDQSNLFAGAQSFWILNNRFPAIGEYQ